MSRNKNKNLSKILLPAALVLALFVAFVVVLMVLVQLGDNTFVVITLKGSIGLIFYSYLILSVVLILFGVWFTEHFYHDSSKRKK